MAYNMHKTLASRNSKPQSKPAHGKNITHTFGIKSTLEHIFPKNQRPYISQLPHALCTTYGSIAELPSRRLVGGGSGGGVGDGARRDRSPPAEEEARTAVRLRLGIVVADARLRHVDPLLLPLPHRAAEHRGGWAVPGRRPAQPRPNSLHLRTPDYLALTGGERLGLCLRSLKLSGSAERAANKLWSACCHRKKDNRETTPLQPNARSAARRVYWLAVLIPFSLCFFCNL